MAAILEGRNALVSGGSRGIGRATALKLASMGANVTITGRDEQALIEAVIQINMVSSPFQQHDFFSADYSQPDKLQAALRRHQKKTGKSYHILVNNTGGPPAGSILEAGAEGFMDAFQAHLISNHLLLTSLAEGMKQSGYGRVVNIISTSVKQPLPNLGVSNTIRGAVASWAKTMANELAVWGITVNNVLPGATETDRLQAIIKNKAHATAADPGDVSAHMKAEIPMKRFARPEEIAEAVAFLCSPAAAYITGINLPVDGGRTSCL